MAKSRMIMPVEFGALSFLRFLQYSRPVPVLPELMGATRGVRIAPRTPQPWCDARMPTSGGSSMMSPWRPAVMATWYLFSPILIGSDLIANGYSQ